MTLLAALSVALAGPPCPGLEAPLAAIEAEPRCLTTALGLLEELADTPASRACAQAWLDDRGLPALGPLTPPPLPPPMPEKQTRDAYGVPYSAESDNFVLRWGPGFSASDAQPILDAFELAWTREILEMGYPEPLYADAWKVNVYVGDSGGGAPSAGSAAGYHTNDREGYPMIVLANSTAHDIPGRGANTTAHELHHALQRAAGTYSYQYEGAWYFEATASWIEVEVYPDEPAYTDLLFGYSFLPHLAINYFDYPDEGVLQEYHQYGAFIFVRYLAEHAADPDLIRESWLDTRGSRDPLAVIDRLLQEDAGTDLDAAFADFAARNATWDYAHGDWYAAAHDSASSLFGRGNDYRIAAQSRGLLADVSPPEEVRPQRYGSNMMRLYDLAEGDDLRVAFEGDAAGDHGNAAVWNVEVIGLFGDEVVREPLGDRLAELAGEGLWLEGMGQADEVLVVVSQTAPELLWDEGFDYTLTAQPGWINGPPDTGDTGLEGPRACGCQAGGGPAGLFALPLLALWRRRRWFSASISAPSSTRKPSR